MPLKLTDSQFREAVKHVRVIETNEKAAYAHLVGGMRMSEVAEKMGYSRQNVFQLVRRIYNAYVTHVAGSRQTQQH